MMEIKSCSFSLCGPGCTTIMLFMFFKGLDDAPLIFLFDGISSDFKYSVTWATVVVFSFPPNLPPPLNFMENVLLTMSLSEQDRKKQ